MIMKLSQSDKKPQQIEKLNFIIINKWISDINYIDVHILQSDKINISCPSFRSPTVPLSPYCGDRRTFVDV